MSLVGERLSLWGVITVRETSREVQFAPAFNDFEKAEKVSCDLELYGLCREGSAVFVMFRKSGNYVWRSRARYVSVLI
jgi:hypothetical protein